MSSNPSHILIARHSRSHNPSASLSSPTETHAAAAGIFRMDGSPPPEDSANRDDERDSSIAEEDIEMDDTFKRAYRFPGTVKIVVQSTTFWAHKEVLFFASPFFEAALSGNWAETTGDRPHSISSVITISQQPTVPGQMSSPPPPETTVMPLEGTESEQEPDSDIELVDPSGTESEGNDSTAYDDTDIHSEDPPPVDEETKKEARDASLAILQGGGGSQSPGTVREESMTRFSARKRRSTKTKRLTMNQADAVIVLKEERASTFHDFLKYLYPHLECTITWNNVESLMNIADKLTVPALYSECLTFLLTHAAGKPIKAMRISELFREEELYRESSRFVLDNPGGWSEWELSTLSQETLLKLEKRRTWFLERVLKLGLVAVAKEYQCCASCPDPSNCARLLEEKWKQCFQGAFRFGAPQPSMVFRYLRNLDTSPPLSLTHLACQTSAKAFTSTLFDRMFSLGLRGSPDSVIGPSRVAAAGVAAATVGPRRHFLYCTLKTESHQKKKTSRD